MMVLWNGEISRPSADNITTVKEINSPFCHAHQSGSQLCYVCITGVFCSCIYVNCVSLMCMCWEGEFVYILQQTNMICMCVCVCVCVFVNFCLYLFVLLCVVLVCRGGLRVSACLCVGWSHITRELACAHSEGNLHTVCTCLVCMFVNWGRDTEVLFQHMKYERAYQISRASYTKHHRLFIQK